MVQTWRSFHHGRGALYEILDKVGLNELFGVHFRWRPTTQAFGSLAYPFKTSIGVDCFHMVLFLELCESRSLLRCVMLLSSGKDLVFRGMMLILRLCFEVRRRWEMLVDNHLFLNDTFYVGILHQLETCFLLQRASDILATRCSFPTLWSGKRRPIRLIDGISKGGWLVI